ncbi:MAG: folylpolyglutamate synthase/dihydrofolate synthase family protein [Bacteroidaceae bacterium]|nr:bifunctional folylpolyglutamate synthase/dihydrofolate synthase [Bacteroidaceae bacterium]
MNYEETLNYLYECAPMFQQKGSKAYKAGLETTLLLDDYFNHPHRKFKTIHVAGTNGKGSCSHILAALFQKAGYKTGLYTSPHLLDFRERIRVNGKTMDTSSVVDFVENHRSFFEPLHPSFFELTTAMAFHYFEQQNIDIAIIEVGLGGRLDCTNIITPELTIITNISLDHTQLLGHSLREIAQEKAGVIKKGIPVIIGETTPVTRSVFLQQAEKVGAPIFFAEEKQWIEKAQHLPNGAWCYTCDAYPALIGELSGNCQIHNTNTLLSAIHQLKKSNFQLTEEDVRAAFAHVCQLTHLKGRWQTIATSPRIICDTGHNIAGMQYIAQQLQQETYTNLHIVIGMVNDKDINGVVALLPKQASYYFTKASVKRALHETELEKIAITHQLEGSCFPTVAEAVNAAMQRATKEDLVFVGGSTFIVADLLKMQEFRKQTKWIAPLKKAIL